MNYFNKNVFLANINNSQSVVEKRRYQALETIRSNYKANNIFNKAVYAGTNDLQNAQRSLEQVRKGGAAVPPKVPFHRPIFSWGQRKQYALPNNGTRPPNTNNGLPGV